MRQQQAAGAVPLKGRGVGQQGGGLLGGPPEVVCASTICFAARDLAFVLFVSSSLFVN